MALQLSRDFVLSQLKIVVAYWCGLDGGVRYRYFAFRGDYAANLILDSFDFNTLLLFLLFTEVCAEVADFKVALLG